MDLGKAVEVKLDVMFPHGFRRFDGQPKGMLRTVHEGYVRQYQRIASDDGSVHAVVVASWPLPVPAAVPE